MLLVGLNIVTRSSVRFLGLNKLTLGSMRDELIVRPFYKSSCSWKKLT